MPIYVGDNVLTEVTDNSNNVLEVSGNYAAIERCNCQGGRSAGDWSAATEVEFNAVANTNNDSGGLSGARFTAPYDGTYWVYAWFMVDAEGAWNNKYWRIWVNGATTKQVSIYMSNGANGYYKESQSGIIVNLDAGDYVSCANYTTRLYGASTAYNRFVVTFLG